MTVVNLFVISRGGGWGARVVGGGELALITTFTLDNAVLFDSYMNSFNLFGHVSS